MYKVFYNQKPLHFTTDLKNNSDQTPLFFIKYAHPKAIVKALKKIGHRGFFIPSQRRADGKTFI